MSTLDPFTEPFGSIFSDSMAVCDFDGNEYTYKGVEPFAPFEVHPGAHTLHYSSNCFEGLKAHRQQDGSIKIFRLSDHAQRFCQSIAHLNVTAPPAELVENIIADTVAANADDTPTQPGSLYVRPVFFGTLPIIGAASAPTANAKICVMTSPVGDYFKGGILPLSLYVEQNMQRTTSSFGMVKGGANYALALGPTLVAKQTHGVDQVLFANNNDVTETGAANFFLVDDKTLITRHLDESFLHGITRASIITLAQELGYEVQERTITIAELKNWQGEAFLSGTAAVIAPVCKLIFDDETVDYSGGKPGHNTLKLRQALTSIQAGLAKDNHGWLTPI